MAVEARKGKGLVRPMTTDRARISRSTPAFCVLQKLSAGSLLASKPRDRPPPMTTSHGHDQGSFFDCSIIYLARLRW